MGAIGSLYLQLGVSSSALDSGLAKAAKKVQAFGNTAGKLATAPIRALTNALNVPASLARGFLAPVQQLLSSIPFVGGALGALVGGGAGFVANLKEQMSAIVATGREAKMLGLSVGTLAGMQLVAGSGAEGLGRSMMHLQHTLGSAAAGSKEAKSKFANLDLDADKLAGEGLEAALGDIADRFVSLKDPVQQATLAYELFGRRGESWIPILARGSAGLKEGRERARTMGLALDQVDVAKVRQATIAISTIQGTVKGVFQQAAVGIAPYITAVGDWFNRLAKDAGGIGPLMQRAFTGAAEAIAVVIDELGELTNQFKQLKALGSKEAIFNVGVGNAHGRGFFSPHGWSEVTDPKQLALEREQRRKMKLEGGTGKAGDVFRGWIKDIGRGAGGGSSAILPFEEQILKAIHLKVAIGDLDDELKKSIATMGQSSDAAKLYDLRQQGATEEQLASTRALISQRDQLEALGKAYDKHGIMAGFRAKAATLQGGNNLDALKGEQAGIEGRLGSRGELMGMNPAGWMESPLKTQILRYQELTKQIDALTGSMTDLAQARDKALFEGAAEIKVKLRPDITQFKDKLDDLGEMFGKGLITAGEASLTALDTFQDLEKKMGLGGEVKSAPGADAGSAEAQSIINRFQAPGQDTSMPARLDAVKQAIIDADLRRAQDARELVDALRRSAMPVIRGQL